jgi:hypothetical protein
VTEPVARTSVRRTVRVAVALVAGQALLCAVIGWVTFGASHAHRPGAPVSTVEPLAGKPLVMPPAVSVPPPRAPSASVTPSAKEKVKTSAPASPRQSPSRRPPAEDSTSPPVMLASPPPRPADVAPSPTPADQVQSPVKLLDVCEPLDAKGLTADGVPVRCVKSADGTLHWQIN